MIHHARGFASGFFAPWRGLAIIINDSRVRWFALLPFTAIVLIFGTGLALGLPLITNWIVPITTWMTGMMGFGKDSSSFQIASWILPILLWPSLAIGLFAITWLVARAGAAPFLTLLAERVLRTKGALESQPFRPVSWFALQIRMLGVSVVRAGIFGIMSLVLIVLSLIPGLGLFTSLALLVLLAFDIADFPLEALEMDFQKRVTFYREHFSVFFGLGVMLGLVFLIPGLNFFLLPAAVVGISEVVHARYRS